MNNSGIDTLEALLETRISEQRQQAPSNYSRFKEIWKHR